MGILDPSPPAIKQRRGTYFYNNLAAIGIACAQATAESSEIGDKTEYTQGSTESAESRNAAITPGCAGTLFFGKKRIEFLFEIFFRKSFSLPIFFFTEFLDSEGRDAAGMQTQTLELLHIFEDSRIDIAPHKRPRRKPPQHVSDPHLFHLPPHDNLRD